MVQQTVLILFHFIHVTAVIVWIGSHFFQLLTMDPAFKLAGRLTEVSALKQVFPRFNQVTGTAAVLTLSSGTALAMLKTQASLLPMITTVWGVLLLLGLVLVLVILFAHPKPNQIRILSNVSIAVLLASLLFALERTRGDLSVFITTLWGQSIMVGAIAGLGIFLLGFVMGQHRVMIAIQSQKILESQKIDESSAEFREFLRLRRRLYILSVPENILTVIVLAAMISAGYLPG